MANWSNPLITTQYDVFVNEAKARDVDAATMFKDAPTNPPLGSVQLVRLGGTAVIFREYNGVSFADVILTMAGGGTGATTAAAARANLGLGTMATQNSNAVFISGGSLLDITGFRAFCTMEMAAHAAFDLGTFTKQVRKGYFASALVLPVGTDLYATS